MFVLPRQASKPQFDALGYVWGTLVSPLPVHPTDVLNALIIIENTSGAAQLEELRRAMNRWLEQLEGNPIRIIYAGIRAVPVQLPIARLKAWLQALGAYQEYVRSSTP
jgi:hypothetical protein